MVYLDNTETVNTCKPTNTFSSKALSNYLMHAHTCAVLQDVNYVYVHRALNSKSCI